VYTANLVANAALTSLAGGQHSPDAIALYGGYVYWTNSADGTVWRAGVSHASGAELVASGQSTPVGIAVDATGIYVANAGASPSYLDGSVTHIAAPGATPTPMLSDEDTLLGLAIDDTYVYAVVAGSGNRTGQILRIPKVY
jgi:hypothetical protein